MATARREERDLSKMLVGSKLVVVSLGLSMASALQLPWTTPRSGSAVSAVMRMKSAEDVMPAAQGSNLAHPRMRVPQPEDVLAIPEVARAAEATCFFGPNPVPEGAKCIFRPNAPCNRKKCQVNKGPCKDNHASK